MLDVRFDHFLNVVKNGDEEEVKCLIKEGFDPNAVFENGLSPIHLAAWYDRPGLIKILVQYRAQVDVKETRTKKLLCILLPIMATWLVVRFLCKVKLLFML